MKQLVSSRLHLKTGRPFTGAWIETTTCIRLADLRLCRPFTGAWIETHPALGALVLRVSPLHGGVD